MSLFLQLELDYVSHFLPWSRNLPEFGRRPFGGPNRILEGSITPQLSDEVLKMLNILCAERLCTMAAEVVVKGVVHPG